MLETLLAITCAFNAETHFESCRTAANAYFAYVKGDEIMETATKKYFKPIEKEYIDPIPGPVKAGAGFVWAFYNQRFQAPINRNLRIDVGRQSSSLVLNYEF